MRCIRFDRFGEPADVLRVHDVPMPSAGQGEVLYQEAGMTQIEVHADPLSAATPGCRGARVTVR